MAPLPFTQPGARIAFDVVLASFVVLEWRARLRSRSHKGASTRLDHGSLLVVAGAVYVAVGGAFLLASRVRGASIPDVRWPLLVAGLVLMVAGIAIRQWAVFVLGRFFTVDVRVHDHQTVVERGPYRWVRHPAYTGLILTFVGIGLALENWAALAILIVVPTAALVVRIHFEEQALLEGLGEPYREFAARRPRLFPGLW
jgi:protein-S-isoprenylcysteine O-methyltransferase Ste14